MSLDQLWAAWRGAYVEDPEARRPASGECVLCGVLEVARADPGTAVHVGDSCSVVLNAYPYTSGHVMVLPHLHVPRLGDLPVEVKTELFDLVDRSVAAIEAAYQPHGMNFGANLGHGSGAGIPDHLHVHALPRWEGDTNFMTSVGATRVMPEGLEESLARLQAAFVTSR